MKKSCFFVLLFLAGCAFGQNINWGVTYSYPHALWLFDDETKAKSVLTTTADELGVKNYRLEAYWNWLQKDSNKQLNLNSIEWQLEVMEKYDAQTVILCIGLKVPHWPEYHIPEWAKHLPEEESKQKILNYLELIVKHYSNDSRITHWQVENEPFFKFGRGKPFSDQEKFLKKEIETVRSLDKLNRKIIVTNPGDRGDFRKTARDADIVGLSYYSISYWKEMRIYVEHKISYNLLFKSVRNPKSWRKKINNETNDKPVWLIELQAEPWGPTDNKFLSVDESAKSMSPTRFRGNLKSVIDAGFTDIYFWGAEWWLWMKDNGHPEMWEEVKKVLK